MGHGLDWTGLFSRGIKGVKRKGKSPSSSSGDERESKLPNNWVGSLLVVAFVFFAWWVHPILGALAIIGGLRRLSINSAERS